MTDKREKKADLNIPGYISEVKVDDNLLDDRVADSIGRRGLLVFAENRLDCEKSSDFESNCEDALSFSDTSSIISIAADKMKVQFDIITTKIVHDSSGKYVKYIVIVMEVPKMDCDRAIIERRFSEFSKLHNGLKKECPKTVANVPFPSKKFFSRNFDDTLIEERSRKLEKYLRYVYHQPGVPETKAFRKFFYRPHLKEATQRLKCEEYRNSYDQYRLALQLQKKLGSNQDEMVVSMCGVVETCRNLKNYEEAEEIGSECLELLQYDVQNPYLLPLMHAVIDARKRLFMNTDGIKRKLKECEKVTAFDLESIKTLRELSVEWC